jgi:anion-transporting  ArsA/GET3 family ATPase
MSRDVLRMPPLVLVTGKGGVGKTTVAAALALESARRGERAVLVEFGDGEAGKRSLGEHASSVAHEVVSFDAALLDAVAQMLRSRMLAKVLVGHSAVRRLVRAAPGLAELVKLERVRELLASGRFARVVVDLPASGHAVGWLRVASAIARFASVGPLHELGRRVEATIHDAARTAVVVVTLAEPLVLRETAELCTTLGAELGRAVDLVAVNRVPTADPPGALGELEALGGVVGAGELARMLEVRRAAVAEATRALEPSGAAFAAAIARIPEQPSDPDPAELIAALAAARPEPMACRA